MQQFSKKQTAVFALIFHTENTAKIWWDIPPAFLLLTNLPFRKLPIHRQYRHSRVRRSAPLVFLPKSSFHQTPVSAARGEVCSLRFPSFDETGWLCLLWKFSGREGGASFKTFPNMHQSVYPIFSVTIIIHFIQKINLFSGTKCLIFKFLSSFIRFFYFRPAMSAESMLQNPKFVKRNARYRLYF